MQTIGVNYCDFLKSKEVSEDSVLYSPSAFVDPNVADTASALHTEHIRQNIGARVGALWPFSAGMSADTPRFESIFNALFEDINKVSDHEILHKKGIELWMNGNNFGAPFAGRKPGNDQAMLDYHRIMINLAQRNHAKIFYSTIIDTDEAVAIARALPPSGANYCKTFYITRIEEVNLLFHLYTC